MIDNDLLLQSIKKSVTFKPNIELYKFKKDLNVTPIRTSYSIGHPTGAPYIFDREKEMEYLISSINSEFIMFISKTIRNEFHKANNHLFINVDNIDDYQIADRVIKYLNYNSYKSFVTNGNIATNLFDHKSFVMSNSSFRYNNFMDFYGSIYGIPLYVDSLIKHTDNAIYLSTEDIFYEVDNVKFSILNEATFTPRIMISFDYKILANNLFILNLVSKGSNMYDEWTKINRDEKIDQILK